MSRCNIKAVLCVIMLSMTACTHQPIEKKTLTKAAEAKNSESVVPANKASERDVANPNMSTNEAERKTEIMMSSDVKKAEVKNPTLYFQKQPNTSVYDLEGRVIKTLRFQSFVPVFLVEDNKAYINRRRTSWVDLSTLTSEQPATMSLPQGSTSNGLETLDREAIKDAIENGRK